MEFPGFCGPSNTSRSRWVNAERTVNLYPETNRPGTPKGRTALYSTPGRSLFATLPASPVRAVWAGDNTGRAVGGGNLYSFTIGGAVTLLGALNAATTPAGISSNGNQLLIVSGDQIFCDNGAGPVSVLTDGYVDACFLDGYFVALRQPTNTNGLTRDQIWVSDLFDGLTWDPLEYQERLTTPDRLIRIVEYRNQLWLFGQKTFECWYNSGNADYPFERVQGSQSEMGVLAWTIAKADEGLMFVGSSERGANRVYLMSGYTPVAVSTPAVEAAITALVPGNVPRAYAYHKGGHSCYVLQAFADQPSWVYDLTEKAWHERGDYNSGTGVFGAHPAVCHANFYVGNHILGDGTSGKLWLESEDIWTNEGAAIVRYRQAPHISDENKTISYAALTLDIETGNAGGGETATAELRWSGDGARTFNAYKSRSLGASGARAKRVQWRALGSSRYGSPVRTFGVKITAKSEIAIAGAWLDIG